MKSDYRKARFELPQFNKFSRSELKAIRDWSKSHPCDFSYCRKNRRAKP